MRRDYYESSEAFSINFRGAGEVESICLVAHNAASVAGLNGGVMKMIAAAFVSAPGRRLLRRIPASPKRLLYRCDFLRLWILMLMAGAAMLRFAHHSPAYFCMISMPVGDCCRAYSRRY